jgi:hypothetical protein
MAKVGLFKTCSKCGEQKLRTAFYTRGLMCRVCTRAKTAAYRAAHLEEVRAHDRARSKAVFHLEHIPRKIRARRKRKAERLREYRRRRREQQQQQQDQMHGERE